MILPKGQLDEEAFYAIFNRMNERLALLTEEVQSLRKVLDKSEAYRVKYEKAVEDLDNLKQDTGLASVVNSMNRMNVHHGKRSK